LFFLSHIKDPNAARERVITCRKTHVSRLLAQNVSNKHRKSRHKEIALFKSRVLKLYFSDYKEQHTRLAFASSP
jgi:hypothetical protein